MFDHAQGVVYTPAPLEARSNAIDESTHILGVVKAGLHTWTPSTLPNGQPRSAKNMSRSSVSLLCSRACVFEILRANCPLATSHGRVGVLSRRAAAQHAATFSFKAPCETFSIDCGAFSLKLGLPCAHTPRRPAFTRPGREDHTPGASTNATTLDISATSAMIS